MRKSILLGIGLSLCLSFTAYAGEWKQDEHGWRWQNDDGTNPVNCWQWLDGNSDGVSENYYFGNDGYLKTNTVIDGYQVDENGAWVVDGKIQIEGGKTQETNDEFSDIMLKHVQLNGLSEDLEKKIFSLNPQWNVEEDFVYSSIQVGEWIYSFFCDDTLIYSANGICTDVQTESYIVRVKPDGSAADILLKSPFPLNGVGNAYSALGKICLSRSVYSTGYAEEYYQYDIVNNTIYKTTKEENEKLKITGTYNKKDNLYYSYDKNTKLLIGRNIYNRIIEQQKVKVDVIMPGGQLTWVEVIEADGDLIEFLVTIRYGGVNVSGPAGQIGNIFKINKKTKELLEQGSEIKVQLY